jgi:hypothetical protein
MAIVFLQQKKAQRNLMLVFVGIIIITAVIVWWGVFRKEKELPKEKAIYPYQKEVKIDFDVLKSSALKELQPFSEIKQILEVEGEIGRDNPFLSF